MGDIKNNNINEISYLTGVTVSGVNSVGNSISFTSSVSITGYKLPIQSPNSGSWTFITDGSDTLTWTQSSGLVLSGTTDNGVITLNGSYPNAIVESNMTFDGTTLNVFSDSALSPLIIASGSSSDDLVRITQTGTGNALVVEDSTNPDSTPFAISSNGNVGIGTTGPVSLLNISDGNVPNTSLYTSDYVIVSAQGTAPGFNIVSSGNGSTHRGVFKATRSRGTLSSPTVPILNDNTFSLLGAIYDGSTNWSTAAINMDVDGTVSSNVTPQRISFWTGTGSVSGNVNRIERMRITSDGKIGIGTTGPSYSLQVVGTVSTTGFQLTTGASNGYILTTDSSGNSSWTSSTSVVSYSPGTGLTLSGSTFSLNIIDKKIIYVSPTGSNSNNGLSELTPVQNLWYARDLASSGYTVVVLPGSYIFDNRNAAGCPYNGLVQTKVNLWKDGVTYHFMPGAKIYSYGSTSISYSPYSDDMIFFQPNSLTYSECYVTGDLEFYANSEGADNSGGNSVLFDGGESNGSLTYPGYTFYMKAKLVNGVTGCTPMRAIRSSVGAGTASIYLDIQTIKYSYTTGQSANAAFSTWRGGDGGEMIVNIKTNQIIANGNLWCPIFQVRPYASSGVNKLRFNANVGFGSFLGYSYFLNLAAANTSAIISSGEVTINCDNCIFSPSLFVISQNYKNYFAKISGNYYCSGQFTSKYSSFPSTYPFICLWDQTNDSITDNTVLDFKGTYYANNPTRTVVHVGGYGGGLPYGTTNNIGNFTGDIYFSMTASNYTGSLFYIDMGKLRFSGRVHGTSNYSGYGFGGSVIQFGSHTSTAILTDTYIHSDLNSYLSSYASAVNGQSSLTIANSYIEMTATSSVLSNMTNVDTYLYNSTIKNKGTSDVFYTTTNNKIQLVNSTLISLSSTASTINYPSGTVTSAGGYSNKDIIVGTLNGTVSVVSALV